jgi:signal transduction histidine kinase
LKGTEIRVATTTMVWLSGQDFLICNSEPDCSRNEAVLCEFMLSVDDDSRITNILDMIGSIASLDFSRQIETSDRHDVLDAIALGLNMLSEELNVRVVDKAKLDEVNAKLEKFAYTTAHDLKSPLNSQYGLLQLLELSLDPGNREAREYIGRLQTVNEKMKSLVEGILAYSVAHLKDVTREEVDWHDILNEVIEVDSVSNHADVEVTGKLPVTYFNRTAGIQVIRNLLDNAIKYSNKQRCKILIDVNSQDDCYQISVTDNGPGIPVEHQEKIFVLFNQVEPSLKASSVGIGLATVKGIIEAHGERIWLKSKPGEGASFIFTISKNSTPNVSRD